MKEKKNIAMAWLDFFIILLLVLGLLSVSKDTIPMYIILKIICIGRIP
jgi:hypothetical protein